MDEKNQKPSGPNNLHDAFFQKSMENPKVARAFLKAHIPETLLKHIDLTQLELQPRIHIDDVGSQYISDLVYKTKMDDQEAYLYLALEHQSYHDPWLAFRILKYTLHIMDRHLKQQRKLPLVYPCVVYHGKSPCRLQPDIRELIDAPKELIDDYFLKPFKLVDLRQIEDQELAQHQWAGLMELEMMTI